MIRPGRIRRLLTLTGRDGGGCEGPPGAPLRDGGLAGGLAPGGSRGMTRVGSGPCEDALFLGAGLPGRSWVGSSPEPTPLLLVP